MAASHMGDVDVVKVLLEKGADVNIVGDKGVTPLMLASQLGYEGIVEMLLKAGADVNIVSEGGVTALMAALQEGYEDVVEMLKREQSKRSTLKQRIHVYKITDVVESRVLEKVRNKRINVRFIEGAERTPKIQHGVLSSFAADVDADGVEMTFANGEKLLVPYPFSVRIDQGK